MSNIKINEFLEKMRSGEVSTGSQFKLRDESIQKKNKSVSIPKIKREARKMSKLLIITEIAIPFDPFVVAETDQFNKSNKFRPLLSQSTVALSLKKFYDENPEMKAKFLKYVGRDEWDTTKESITDEDFDVFRRFRVPRVFTIPSININIPILTGSQFGRNYQINVERDELGRVAGEYPLPLKANKLFQDRAYEEIQYYQDAVKNGILDMTDKALENKVKEIYSAIPVSTDYPVNFIVAAELALDNDYSLKVEDLKSLKAEDIQKSFVLSKLTKELNENIQDYMTGKNARRDKSFDFWELDMKCPSDGDNAMEIGRDTRYSKAEFPIVEAKGYDEYIKNFSSAIDEFVDMEKVVLYSSRITPFNEDVEKRFLDSLSTVIDLDNDKYITAKVIKTNAELITLVFGDKGDEKIAEAEMGMIEEGKLDEESSEKTGRSISLSALMKDDEEAVDTDTVELDLEE